MAKCPKCGTHLHIYNISQFCPQCGVNMRFVNFEENFFREAKYAELSQASVHVKIRQLKAAFIGSKLNIARLVVVILPLVSLLIPSGSYDVLIPIKEVSGQFSILGVVNLFTKGSFGYIMSMVQSDIFGNDFVTLRNALFAYLSVAVCGLLVFIVTALCFVSIKKMQKVICAFCVLGIVDCIFAFFVLMMSKSPSSVIASIRLGFGLFVTIAMFIVVFVINFILDKKGIDVTYAEGMMERYEIYKQYKDGKVSLDDLPQPVVETEETRKIDEKIREEEVSMQEKRKAQKEENAND